MQQRHARVEGSHADECEDGLGEDDLLEDLDGRVAGGDEGQHFGVGVVHQRPVDHRAIRHEGAGPLPVNFLSFV